MSIALKCEIFIVMRYEQLCVLCLVCVECESPTNAAADDDDDDRSHGETTALSHGLEQSDKHVHTCSCSTPIDRPTDSELLLFLVRATFFFTAFMTDRERGTETASQCVLIRNATQPLIRI